MHLQGQVARCLDFAYELEGNIGGEDAGHVFDADRVGAGAGHLVGQAHEVAHGVHVARGVGDGGLDLAARLLGGADGGCKVAGVVQRVEDADDVDAVLHGFLHEGLDHVVGVVAVAEQVLAAQQHLQLGVLDAGANGAQALPRVLVQVAQAAVERGTAPDLEGLEAALVERLEDGEHVLDGHARGDLTLLAVAQDGLHEADLAGHARPPSTAGRVGRGRARSRR